MTPSAANVIGSGATRRPLPPASRKLITFAAAAAVLAGCSSGQPAASTAADASAANRVQQVAISTTDDFRFAPATPTVHVGRVHITITDAGTYPHNLSIGALHQTSATVSGLPGQRITSLDVTFDKPGRYAFVCTYHSSAGMKGTIVVLKRP